MRKMPYSARPGLDSVYGDRDDNSGFARGGRCQCASCRAKRKLRAELRAAGGRTKPRADRRPIAPDGELHLPVKHFRAHGGRLHRDDGGDVDPDALSNPMGDRSAPPLAL